MISKFTRSFLLSCIALLLIGSLFFLNPPIRIYHDAVNHAWFNEDGVDPSLQKPQPPPAPPQVEAGTVNGGVIMGKLGNETAKAELGRATWKLLHTMTLRFPETPTDDEREALRAYIHLTSRLYPCGECAEHFQKLLEEYPPQTSSRKTASQWLCYVHNLVNKRLKKQDFDCTKLDATYDCGCGDDPVEQKKKKNPLEGFSPAPPPVKGG